MDDVTSAMAPHPPEPEDGSGSRAPWLVVLAVVLVAAGVAGLLLLDRGDDDTDTPPADSTETATQGATDDDQASEESVTMLQPPEGAGSARCAVPTAQILGRHQLAFDGTVTAISEREVTLEPNMFYAGDPTDLVVVRAPLGQLRNLLVSVEFQEGERYLVAAEGKQVSICGYSGPWSEDLEKLYVEAFPG